MGSHNPTEANKQSFKCNFNMSIDYSPKTNKIGRYKIHIQAKTRTI